MIPYESERPEHHIIVYWSYINSTDDTMFRSNYCILKSSLLVIGNYKSAQMETINKISIFFHSQGLFI